MIARAKVLRPLKASGFIRGNPSPDGSKVLPLGICAVRLAFMLLALATLPTLAGTVTGSLNKIMMGGRGEYTFPGYIDEVRITNGVARYTGTFTPSAVFPTH